MANNVYCKYCGLSFPDVRTLVINLCRNHPAGIGTHHELYQGSEKSEYTCVHCGLKFRKLTDLTINKCQRNPAGRNCCHEPAL